MFNRLFNFWLVFAGLFILGIAGCFNGADPESAADDDSGSSDTAVANNSTNAAHQNVDRSRHAKTTATNGFIYPLDSMTAWTDAYGTYAGYAACGSAHYYYNTCHIGVDIAGARGTKVYAMAAGTVLYRSGKQDSTCSSGWNYDPTSATCDMALVVQHYDDDGTPFIVIYGHLLYTTTYTTGSTVSPGDILGQLGDQYTKSTGAYYTASHLHFGVFPGTSATFPTSGWGTSYCTKSQATSTTLPSGCTSNGFTAPGTFIGAAGRAWVAPPSAPTLSSPASGTSFTVSSGTTYTVPFAWTNSSGTYRTHIMVCKNAALTSSCINPDGGMDGYESTSVGATRATSYTYALTKGTWYWAVRTIAYNDYGGFSSYSTVRSLTVK